MPVRAYQQWRTPAPADIPLHVSKMEPQGVPEMQTICTLAPTYDKPDWHGLLLVYPAERCKTEIVCTVMHSHLF